MAEAEQAPASTPETVVIYDALNATASNGTAKFVATPEGTALAYGSLVLMALLPIFFGALRSVTCSKSKVRSTLSGSTACSARLAGGASGGPLSREPAQIGRFFFFWDSRLLNGVVVMKYVTSRLSE